MFSCCITHLNLSIQVLLQEPIANPDGDITLWFMVFGGGYQAAFFKPCSDFSLRIRLDVRCTTKPCTHTFGEWEVETMLGHRCMLDAVPLPNGHLLLIGGTEEGLSNLDYKPNSCNEPVNEPWLYDPNAPAGSRYRRTGAFTRIARMYHSSHLLTSYGDVLCSGESVGVGVWGGHNKCASCCVTHCRWWVAAEHHGPWPAVARSADDTPTLVCCCVAIAACRRDDRSGLHKLPCSRF